MAVTAARMMNGGGGGDGGHVAVVGDREIGASMMEQLVPEITTHALSYLDYPSLCRLSMTNSSMRRAANDDNAWKALYHKAFRSALKQLAKRESIKIHNKVDVGLRINLNSIREVLIYCLLGVNFGINKGCLRLLTKYVFKL
uniref:F-box protein SKIP8-like isoform X1 n=1 Tax=Tanacetum cinerariifolium TaxID=118510 RepID=A0A6L2JTY9_TANCI|nr:F-box protein SKIP8-like isoform X1 [Tanacetum cinerariifolium]